MNRLFLLTVGVAATLTAPAPVGADGNVDFVRDVRPILQKHCYSCHGAEKQKSSLRLDIKSEAFRGGEAYGPSLVPGKPDESPLIQFVADPDADLQMPPDVEPLSEAEVTVLTNWVKAGAVWPDGVDLAQLVDRRDHWSFKPLRTLDFPRLAADRWGHNEIDPFVLARLEEKALQPSPEADRRTWLRRVYFDLVGLPPTPEQLNAFLEDSRDDAYERVVDSLLNSPRYGERWAQHWLDVVRYADTHGFEVNTPRPNAWPYRDYVIAALNRDTPYDRFIREQLAGDTLQQDAATGFLVTAAVLLPGQIGKDEASKRLARQDALAEILINTGEAFLGLSIGCARCHDHKFDAISQRDYYSMQAFFSGVQYEERPLRSDATDVRRQQVDKLRERVAEIDRVLAGFEPLARLGPGPLPTSPRINQLTFDPLNAKFVRFTIHDANHHPTLGLIQPCIDEFEIHTDASASSDEGGEEQLNMALADFGTRVTASGSKVSEAHKLEHVNDGQYGNSRSWMSDEAGRGWVQFEFPEPRRISRVVWSRDRDGHFTDRLATAYTLEAGLSLDALRTLADVPPLRPVVTASRNVDRFQPVMARGLRFTIQATNTLAPCIDELEVFDLSGRNVALAAAGATVRSSGDGPRTEHHKLEYLTDGRFGNTRSWMSSEPGKGWVEVTFAQPTTIDRVAWARDREGKYTDRLATEYSVEVVLENGERELVAQSTDRKPYSEAEAGKPPGGNAFKIQGLTLEASSEAAPLLDEKQKLEQEIEAASQTAMVFAGQFTDPETTHLLFRGDPEQPREEVAPAVLEALGKVRLEKEASETSRRQALAEWIADPQNPLTARVMVNRIWQWHFGTGLVQTASDFGRSGASPSHPELLDWLAGEFIRSGWSIKQMHRLIVLSATYRQASQANAEGEAIDSEVRFLWRYPSRRLEAEAIRDSMLAVSGRLNLKMGGPGFDLFESRGGLSGFPPVESFDAEGRRRLIYAHKIRMERDVVFGAFDCPDAGQSTARRRQSTTPIQALNLFNSPFTIEESAAFAGRVQSEAGDEVERQIERVYQLAFGRDPDEVELQDAASVVREHGLSTLCRVVFNSNEFLFLP